MEKFLTAVVLVAALSIENATMRHERHAKSLCCHALRRGQNDIPVDLIQSVISEWTPSPMTMNMNQLIQCRDEKSIWSSQCDSVIRSQLKKGNRRNRSQILFDTTNQTFVLRLKKINKSSSSSICIRFDIDANYFHNAASFWRIVKSRQYYALGHGQFLMIKMIPIHATVCTHIINQVAVSWQSKHYKVVGIHRIHRRPNFAVKNHVSKTIEI